MMVVFLCLSIEAAETNWTEVYTEIREGNAELIALKLQSAAHYNEISSQFRWDDLQVGGYYLTNPNSPSDYTEWEISQQLPSLLSLGTQQQYLQQLDVLNHQQIRSLEQELLLKSTFWLLELVYLHRRSKTVEHRQTLAEKHLQHYQALLTAGEVSASEVQKVQLVALENQFALQKVDTDIQHALQRLEQLKGSPLTVHPTTYPRDIEPIDPTSLWEERVQQDIDLQKAQSNTRLAETYWKMEKQRLFPSISIGANSQGILNDRYSGVYLGMSIPLYKSSKSITSASLQHQQSLSMQKHMLSVATQQFNTQYREFTALHSQYEQMQSILSAVPYEAQLESQLTSGALSFVQYHREYEFYIQAEDQLLVLELQLQQLMAELQAHRLLEEP